VVYVLAYLGCGVRRNAALENIGYTG